MKVLYDHQIFTLQEYGGISRQYYELINRFDNHGQNNAEVSLLLTNNAYLNAKTYPGTYPFLSRIKFRGKVRTMNYINKRVSIKKINENNFDVFHPTYYDPYFLQYLGNKPFVVTVLDMIHEKFASQFRELAEEHPMYNNKKILLEKAARIIAISETTKKDIIDIFGTSDDKIDVIYLGSSLRPGDKNKIRLHHNPYLLYVGTRAIYKNFTFFLKSIPDILRKSSGLNLICAGGGEFTKEESDLINKLDLNGKVIHYQIDDGILTNLYHNAEAFVFPSLYEGFGIPVLEAFSCGCPCVLSNGGSLPEVGGEAALYFEPVDEDSIRSAINKILSNKNLKERLAQSGEKRLKLFSWDKNYEETIELYKKIS